MPIRGNGRCVIVLALLLGIPTQSFPCEFCTAPSITLGEQRDQAAAVLHVKWIANSEPKVQLGPGLSAQVRTARTEYEVVNVLVDREDRFRSSKSLFVPGISPPQSDPSFLLLASGDEQEWTWGTPQAVTPEAVEYIKNLPNSEKTTAERLKYFIDYLESPDVMIANDAYGEFAQAPFSEIRQLRESLPRTKIRRCVSDENTEVTRLGLYGILLGLCGDEDDAQLMAQKIRTPTSAGEIRLGIDGVMAGYLLLKGEEGLPLIEEILRKQESQPNYTEIFAAMKAIEFCWNYEKSVSRERLKQTQRVLLEYPEVAELAITSLARWKDWTVQKRLVEMYDQKAFDIPSIKRAILRYLLACSNEIDPSKGVPSSHAVSAKKHLKALREKDPATIRQVERFYRLN